MVASDSRAAMDVPSNASCVPLNPLQNVKHAKTLFVKGHAKEYNNVDLKKHPVCTY